MFHLDYGKNELIKSPKKAKKFGKASGGLGALMPSIYTFKGITLINKDHHTYTLFFIYLDYFQVNLMNKIVKT